MQHCRNAAALYLYDNRLTRIQHIDQCRYLTSLYVVLTLPADVGLWLTLPLAWPPVLFDRYLQRNKIERISGLGSLISLEKLYVLNDLQMLMPQLANCGFSP